MTRDEGPGRGGLPRQVVVVPPSEIDVGTAPALAARIADALKGGAAVAVDFDGVQFCDSSGLRVLVQAAKHSRALGRGFTVHNPTVRLQRLADILGATDLLGLPPAPRR